MNITQLKARIASARKVGADFCHNTPPEVQSALMDLATIADHLVEQRGGAPLLPRNQTEDLRMLTRHDVLRYEIRSSWWAAFAG